MDPDAHISIKRGKARKLNYMGLFEHGYRTVAQRLSLLAVVILCYRQIFFTQFQFWIIEFFNCRSNFLSIGLR